MNFKTITKCFIEKMEESILFRIGVAISIGLFLNFVFYRVIPFNDNTEIETLRTVILSVILTFGLGELSKYTERKKTEKPEVFIPVKYDIAKAVNIQFIGRNGNKQDLLQTHVYIKNTEKTPFYIDFLINSGNTYMPPMGSFFCDKGELVCISISDKILNPICILGTHSISDVEYCFRVDLKNKSVTLNDKK